MPREKGNPDIKISQAQLKQLETMAGLGLKVSQMAALLGMSRATLERRMADDPAVAETIEKGRAVAGTNITQTAYDMARSGKHPAMTIFWLKCRQNWREKTIIQHEGHGGGPINYADTSEEEIDRRIREKLKSLLGDDPS